MNAFPSLTFAELNPPLFGNQWLVLLAVLVGVALVIGALAGVGHWLAATHPDAPSRAALRPVVAEEGISPEALAVIAAAVAVTVGSRAHIASIVPVKPATPSVEMLMQQWSVEGRRQIYSSHQIR